MKVSVSFLTYRIHCRVLTVEIKRIPENESIKKKQYTSCLGHNLSLLYSESRGKIFKFVFPAYLSQFNSLFMPRCFNFFTLSLVPILVPV